MPSAVWEGLFSLKLCLTLLCLVLSTFPFLMVVIQKVLKWCLNPLKTLNFCKFFLLCLPILSSLCEVPLRLNTCVSVQQMA